jgi:uncharacterized protein YbjT (DUF2867 family)
MTMASTTIAIIGASGTNASPWTDAFLAAGWKVRNLVRDPGRLPPRTNRTVATLDLGDRRSYEPALAGVDVLGLVTPAAPQQAERETGLIEAAGRSGVAGIIRVSVMGAELPQPISPFARWAAEIDAALSRSNIPHVLLRANGYMQNLLRQRASIEAGHYVQPTEETAASYLDVRDIADVAVAAANGSFDGKVLTLTGPEALSGAQIAAVLSEAVGRPVRFVSPDLERFGVELIQNGVPRWRVDALVEVHSNILAGRGSHLSAVSPDVLAATGRPPRVLREFAEHAFNLRSVA